MSVEKTTCTDPATGQVIGHSALDSAGDIEAAVGRGREAWPAWAATPLKHRIRMMRRVRDHIVAHADDLARTVARDNGKTLTDAMATEVVHAAMAVSYYSRKARCFLADRATGLGTIVLANKASRVRRVPFGVVGVISPWNYPFSIPFSEVVMGLLAGNAVVLKCASETQMVGRALEESIAAAGLPAGVFGYVNVPGRIAGDAFLAAGVDKLFFTGSVGVGRELMHKAARTLTPLSLELGGNDPMLVCPDADPERASAGAVWAGLQSAGQSCGAVERIYVHRDVHDRFLDLLSAKVRALRVGLPTDLDADMGAMTTRSQMQTVREHVDEALEKGAVVHAESRVPQDSSGNFLPAVVLTGVDHTMRIMREETFGPVLAVMKVESMDEAVELANDSELGLSGSVWSRSARRADRIGRRLRTGAVMVNDHLMSHGMPETPWGGFRNSGIGRVHGRIGFDEMTEPQCIVHDHMPLARRNMWWHPHGRKVYEGLRGILHLLWGSGIGRRLAGLAAVLRLFPRTFSRSSS